VSSSFLRWLLQHLLSNRKRSPIFCCSPRLRLHRVFGRFRLNDNPRFRWRGLSDGVSPAQLCRWSGARWNIFQEQASFRCPTRYLGARRRGHIESPRPCCQQFSVARWVLYLANRSDPGLAYPHEGPRKTEPNRPTKTALAPTPYFTPRVVFRLNFMSLQDLRSTSCGLACGPASSSDAMPLWKGSRCNVCASGIGDRQCFDTSRSIPSQSSDKSFVRNVMWVSHCVPWHARLSRM
jgi:hypothetical protein